MHAVVGKLV